MATADPPPQPSLRRDRTPCCPGSTTRGASPPGWAGSARHQACGKCVLAGRAFAYPQHRHL